MEKPEKEDFNLHDLSYFLSSKVSSSCFRCVEWSDGRTEGGIWTPSPVQKSRTTGKYVWLDDYIAEGNSMGVENKPKIHRFHDLQEAYHQLECAGELGDERCVQFLWEIVREFNKRYRCGSKSKNRSVTLDDCKFYIDCILELLGKGGDCMSSFEKMELYREAGMFSKCFRIYESGVRGRSKEMYDELLFRAAHGDSSPFML